MLTLLYVLIIGGLVCTILSALNKCPLWIAVILAFLVLGLQVLPK